MAQRTLLELVQGILSEMSSDEVNSIADTIEATSVAETMAQVYSEMVDEFSLPSTQVIQPLTGLGDTNRPNIMQFPDDVWNPKWIKYDCRVEISGNINYQNITYLCPEDFINMMTSGPSTDTTNYQIVYENSIPLVVNKFKGPSYWTTFDQNYVVFDSYDSNVDSTLQSSKSITMSETRPDFFVEDGFVPELQENLENVLYIRTLNRCLANFKTTVNPATDKQERRMSVRIMRTKDRLNKPTRGPDYGRK